MPEGSVRNFDEISDRLKKRLTFDFTFQQLNVK